MSIREFCGIVNIAELAKVQALAKRHLDWTKPRPKKRRKKSKTAKKPPKGKK